MDNHFDRRERTIYVWMLERSVTDDQLYSLFSKIGPIEKLIFKEYADGTPQHCLIVFRYVDSVLTAMSTLQGTELNGKPISLRPLRESTHAVLMPPSTMYPSKERTTTVTSSDGFSDDHTDDHYGKVVGKKVRSNWDAVSSTGSDSSCVWKVADELEAATERLTLDERRKDATESRSCASYSSISSGAGSPSHSLSPPPQNQHKYQTYHSTHAAIHGSLRKPWRPSRGPIPAPLLTTGGFTSRNHQPHSRAQEEYGGGGAGDMYEPRASSVRHSTGSIPPPSLFSQIISPSPGHGSPSPYVPGPLQSFFGSGVAPSPRPLLREMYRPAGGAGRHAAPNGVFSPTAAPEEVLWHQHNGGPFPGAASTPLRSLLSSGGQNCFEYTEYSVPHAYRGSGTDHHFPAATATAAASGQATNQPPLSLGGMLPPNSPPIGQCARFFDFSSSSATLPRLRPTHSSHGVLPISARPQAVSPFAGPRSTSRAPRSAAPFSVNPDSCHQQHPNSPFALPEFRSFGGRY